MATLASLRASLRCIGSNAPQFAISNSSVLLYCGLDCKAVPCAYIASLAAAVAYSKGPFTFE